MKEKEKNPFCSGIGDVLFMSSPGLTLICNAERRLIINNGGRQSAFVESSVAIICDIGEKS